MLLSPAPIGLEGGSANLAQNQLQDWDLQGCTAENSNFLFFFVCGFRGFQQARS
jgi:hypothetical protein